MQIAELISANKGIFLKKLFNLARSAPSVLLVLIKNEDVVPHRLDDHLGIMNELMKQLILNLTVKLVLEHLYKIDHNFHQRNQSTTLEYLFLLLQQPLGNVLHSLDLLVQVLVLLLHYLFQVLLVDEVELLYRVTNCRDQLAYNVVSILHIPQMLVLRRDQLLALHILYRLQDLLPSLNQFLMKMSSVTLNAVEQLTHILHL